MSLRNVKTVRKLPKVITVDWLKKLGACSYGINDFNVNFPSGNCTVSIENLKKFSNLDIEWLSGKLFSQVYLNHFSSKISIIHTERTRKKNLVDSAALTLNVIKSNTVSYNEREKLKKHIDEEYHNKYTTLMFNIATKKDVPIVL